MEISLAMQYESLESPAHCNLLFRKLWLGVQLCIAFLLVEDTHVFSKAAHKSYNGTEPDRTSQHFGAETNDAGTEKRKHSLFRRRVDRQRRDAIEAAYGSDTADFKGKNKQKRVSFYFRSNFGKERKGNKKFRPRASPYSFPESHSCPVPGDGTAAAQASTCTRHPSNPRLSR